MSQRFDAILKHLPEEYPEDWARFVGVSAPVSVIDANVSTVTAAADKVLRVDAPEPWILHWEFQASRDVTLARRLLHYNVLLGIRHSLPVRSVVLLLRPAADGRDLTGTLQWRLPHAPPYLEFAYEVIRLWQLPPEAVLQGGLGTLPLAPLTNVAPPKLSGLIEQMARRIDREADIPAAKSLWTATYVLMGLEFTAEVSNQLLRGVRSMKESATYQAILQEGLEKGLEKGREEALEILLSQGTRRFGKPPAKTRKMIGQITDREVLKSLALRLLEVDNWTELLADLK